MYTALSIAGSDPSGGAGIQADLKTMTCNGVFAMCVITALTAQNTTGVSGIFDVDPAFVKEQIEMVFSDIRPNAVKIGMTSSAPLMRAIAQTLKKEHAQHIVLDPVMVATSGSALMEPEALETLKTELIPIAELITPNIPEAETLSGMKIETRDDMEKAAVLLHKQLGAAVLIKGGHLVEDANDLLFDGEELTWFYGERIHTDNTHGTGCTLSSAIAANLAKGFSLIDSIERSKAYLSEALADGLNLGQGSGPMNHAFAGHEAYFACADDEEES